jgi:transcriptional regulator with XRE-family HTH domain
MNFGEILKELRLNANLKQSELGKMLNVRNTTVSAWEKNENEPDLNTLKRISQIFNVSIDYLLKNE